MAVASVEPPHRNYQEVLVSGLFDSIGVYRETEPRHRARAKAWLECLAIDAEFDVTFRELSCGQQHWCQSRGPPSKCRYWF